MVAAGVEGVATKKKKSVNRVRPIKLRPLLFNKHEANSMEFRNVGQC